MKSSASINNLNKEDSDYAPKMRDNVLLKNNVPHVPKINGVNIIQKITNMSTHVKNIT